MSYTRLNVVLGWLMFFIATTVYFMTLEPTMPFWDCGEFIASAYKLEVGHPPGAPLFMLIARVFSAFVAPENVPFMVNGLSAICSGATIMFLFWTITHLAKKIVAKDGDENDAKHWVILGAGTIGAMAYAFSDTFWFSAVEGEVYAMSSLFTAVVFWAILKWEGEADEPSHLRWIILIAYLMGLSIGVHLLNLLAIPAIAFVYYFKKYAFSWKGVFATAGISLVLLGLMQTVVIIWFVKLAAVFEKFFVNTLGLGFNSGVLFYILLLISALIGMIWYSKKKGWVVVNTLTWSISVALLGYTSFATILIRSQAQTPMNENRPSNVFAFVSYLNREQYGDRPLVRGQYFNTKQSTSKPYTDGDAVYIPSYSVREKTGKKKLVISCRSEFEAQQYMQANPGNYEMVKEYIDTGEKKASEPNYAQSYIFPRMYSSQGSHVEQYKQWAEIENFKQIMKSGQAPTQGENMNFFFSYQVNWMYWRYFMWNFAGRQNDVQGHTGDFQDGNWKSGIGFFDEGRLGNQENLPEIQKNNKANNSYYFIPLILGLLGLIYQITRHRQDAFVVGLLFLLTGLAIVVYLNQTPLQPRERDYAYAGSFYAFTIWIGLGVVALYFWGKTLLQAIPRPVLAGIAILLASSAPILMGAQGWDDHDRSNRRAGIDMAKNYLNSLAPNAIIFTNGDNDTFPLWYAQEVEGVRTDVRVVNLSLLNTDWYIDQMKRRQYESAPVPFKMPEQKYRQGTRDLIILMQDSVPTDLSEAVNYCLNDENVYDAKYKKFNTLPNFQFKLPISEQVQQQFKPFEFKNSKVVSEMQFALFEDDGETPKQFITKAQLMVMDLIVSNNWERPIYFAVTTGGEAYMGLEPYFQLEGLAYRLTPVYHEDYDQRNNNAGGVAADIMYDNVMNKFQWGNIDKENVYLDENARRMVVNLRMQMNNLAEQFIIEGRNDMAIKVLKKSLESLPEKNAPYDQAQIMWQTAELLLKAGDIETGKAIAKRMIELNQQILTYSTSLDNTRRESMKRDVQIAGLINDELVQDLKKYAPNDPLTKEMEASHEKSLKEVGLLDLVKGERDKKLMYEEQKRLYDSVMNAQKKSDTLKQSKSSKLDL